MRLASALHQLFGEDGHVTRHVGREREERDDAAHVHEARDRGSGPAQPEVLEVPAPPCIISNCSGFEKSFVGSVIAEPDSDALVMLSQKGVIEGEIRARGSK